MLGEQSTELQVRVLKILGSKFSEAEGANLVGVIVAGLANAEPKEVVSICRELLNRLHCNGKPVDMNTLFVGKPKAMWEAVYKTLEKEWGDFFAILAPM